MKDLHSEEFIDALMKHDNNKIKMVPKSDLHNHFVLGGCREYIKLKTGFEIPFFDGVLSSMNDMHAWNSKYIGEHFDSKEMQTLLIEATFVQAKEDGVKVLEIGEDVWGLGEYFDNDIKQLIHTFQDANQRIAPEIELRLQIGLSRHCPIDYLINCLEPFWGNKNFYSIDLYGDELAQPIENFIPIYRRAKKEGLRLKAHVGEWGTAEDVKKAVELLKLDEVQHGIAAAGSADVVRFLIDNHIRLNITPTSNVKLGRICSLQEHPIRELYQAGVDVTINSDDILIFDSDISKEYLKLYEAGVLSAEELDVICINGLRKL
jgi:adenosine deaminase